MNYHSGVLIIGSGPAGYTAAIYAARSGLKPLLIRGNQPGGQLTITTDVENYPGFAETIQGPWLMEQMAAQAVNVGTELKSDHIVSVDFTTRPFKAIGESGAVYTGDTIIIATGAQAKWLGIPSETKFLGFGVSGCATCDGFFYRNKKVMVIGGGNTAVEDALYLSAQASEVTLVHRRNKLRAEKILQERLFANPKVKVIWDSVVEEITGVDEPLGVTGIKLRNLKTDSVAEYAIDGVFIAIGHKPNTDLFRGIMEMDKDGYLYAAPDSTRTNIPGVFAAGDVKDRIYRQAVTAAGFGCMAALEAVKFLAESEPLRK